MAEVPDRPWHRESTPDEPRALKAEGVRWVVGGAALLIALAVLLPFNGRDTSDDGVSPRQSACAEASRLAAEIDAEIYANNAFRGWSDEDPAEFKARSERQGKLAHDCIAPKS
ncbi:hypothetical protein GCM10023205_24850 [Yinghuangia aomiensis]|uniref:Uncharacterized protein n=1 Tax=Yinghuangia aomiensis TaxID=676205 RepID=A0ABP9H6F5_9ACTN